MRTGTARVAARGSRLCVATSAINSRTWSELSWGGKQADFARVCFCTRKRQQASEALDSARAKAGTVLNFIRAFSYFSTEAITSIVILHGQQLPMGTASSFGRRDQTGRRWLRSRGCKHGPRSRLEVREPPRSQRQARERLPAAQYAVTDGE